MREVLQALAGKRFRVTGEVSRFGKRKAFKGPDLETVCIEWLRGESGNLLADHIWLTVGSQLKALKLKVGDKVSFSARSTSYVKGYKGRRKSVSKPMELDYRLSNATKFIKVSQVGTVPLGGLFEGT